MVRDHLELWDGIKLVPVTVGLIMAGAGLLVASTARGVLTFGITVAVAAVCGRILSATFVYEPPLYRNAEDPPPGRIWPKTRPTVTRAPC